ncbi:hypothetical protein SDC9_146183 [bioreactor metagenome]|uniref:Uncharacterized protein n=1 Tax=bioreactor metagenome TaxID=1076179 RepID=A0A645EDZ9_9ZZZZ
MTAFHQRFGKLLFLGQIEPGFLSLFKVVDDERNNNEDQNQRKCAHNNRKHEDPAREQFAALNTLTCDSCGLVIKFGQQMRYLQGNILLGKGELLHLFFDSRQLS